MSTPREESTSMSYEVKVVKEGFNIAEIDDVHTGDTLTFYNDSGGPATLTFPRGMANILSVTIESERSLKVELTALDDGLYDVTKEMVPIGGNEPMVLKIKVGGR